MKYVFTASGHQNIRATHKTTLEFTHDPHLTPKGDCIVAVSADFDISKLKKFLYKDEVRITIAVDHTKEKIIAKPNPEFSDRNEMVIRLGDFRSARTFAIDADKAAKHLKKELITKLTDPKPK